MKCDKFCKAVFKWHQNSLKFSNYLNIITRCIENRFYRVVAPKLLTRTLEFSSILKSFEKYIYICMYIYTYLSKIYDTNANLVKRNALNAVLSGDEKFKYFQRFKCTPANICDRITLSDVWLRHGYKHCALWKLCGAL